MTDRRHARWTALPLVHALRNLRARWVTSLLTAAGMALVVFVFAAVRMIGAGLEATLVATGEPGNLMITSDGAETEIQSTLARDQAAVVLARPELARGGGRRPLASREVVVLIALPQRDGLRPANVTLRGMETAGRALRPRARLVAGRWFARGADEVVAGRSIANRFQGGGVGESLRFAGRSWRVTGVIDAGGTAFDSEVWGDLDAFMQAWRREAYSLMLLRLAAPELEPGMRAALMADPRLRIDVQSETDFYARQSRALSGFFDVLGWVLSLVFSLAAIIGAMLTMYASVAARTAEVGTLRAIGFRRRTIFASFLVESLLLGLIGGGAGVVAAALLGTVSVSTLNWQTFSEIAFRLTLTPEIALAGLVFALVMGLVGGALPALRAARLDILTALRAS
jgi:putative ABC transport system permease protein